LAARRVRQLAGVSPSEAPVFLARLNYPTYFSDLILEYAAQYQLDPLYVFALIWQESLFEGFAVSSASAQGLMQIWPPTGEDIASRLSWPNYQSTDLQRPYVSVAFGTWLLHEESDRFGGDLFAILSAYNAGPGNTATWLEEAGGDPDLFVEFITLPEPQSYIKAIYAHYAVYRVLYGAE
jgi:soluble lytic murein transglycosylase